MNKTQPVAAADPRRGRSRSGIAGLAMAVAIAGGAAFAPAAFATTYSNPGQPGHGVCCIVQQSPIGEVFDLSSAQSLTNWTYYASGGSGGTMDLTIAAWNGSHVVGPALYTGSVDYASTTGGPLAFDNIDLPLSSGSYIAFLDLPDSAAAAFNVGLQGAQTDGGLGVDLRFLNQTLLGDTTPLTYTGTWAFWQPDRNLAFAATFSPTVTPTAVPEPESIALMLAGLGLTGLAARRRQASGQRSQVDVATGARSTAV